jgi:hypothetical protein
VHGMSARRYAGKLAANKRYRERHPEKIRAYKLEPYMEKHGLTHEQVHGPEVRRKTTKTKPLKGCATLQCLQPYAQEKTIPRGYRWPVLR